MNFRTAVSAAAVLLLTACEPEGGYDTVPRADDLYTLKSGVAAHRTDDDSLYYLNASMDSPSLSRIFAPDEGERIVWTQTGPEASAPTRLFVLTEPIDPRDTDLNERLYRVTTDGKAPTVYEIGSRFDRMVFSPDERFAVLFHSGEQSAAGLYNPNEAALVDLSARPSGTNPQVLSVSMDGNRINRVEFVSGLRIGGTERDLAVFLAGSIARIVDLNDPEGVWAKVPLLPSGSSGFVAEQLIALDETDGCDNAACEAKLFIRCPSTTDIYYITLGRNGDGFEGVQTKQLEAGGYPFAMEVIRDGDAVLLAVLSASSGTGKLNVVNIDTSTSFSMTLSGRLTQMKQVKDAEGDTLVLWGNGSSAVYFVTVENLGKEKGRNVESFVVEGGIGYARELEGDRLLLLPNARDLVLLDLTTADAAMLSSNGEYDWAAAQMYGDMFYAIPSSAYADRVDYYDLDRGSPDSLLLDDPAASLHLVTGRKTGVVWHPSPTGRVTLFPLTSPERGKSKVVDGLWLTGILDGKGAR